MRELHPFTGCGACSSDDARDLFQPQTRNAIVTEMSIGCGTEYLSGLQRF